MFRLLPFTKGSVTQGKSCTVSLRKHKDLYTKMLTLMQTYTQHRCIDRLLVSLQTPFTTVSPGTQHLSKANKGHPFSLAPVTLCLYTQQSLYTCTENHPVWQIPLDCCV